jgi:hypothetical protein
LVRSSTEILGGHRQRLQERLADERAIQPDLDDADLVVALVQPLHHLVDGLGAGAHDHDHVLGLGVSDVVEESVGASRHLGEAIHGCLDVARAGVVEAVDGFTGLEEGVRVLGGTANHRTVGAQGTVAMGADLVLVHQPAELIVRQQLDLGDLVGSPEAIEEVDEGNAAGQGGHLRDAGEVVRLLHRAAAQHAPAGLPAGVDVRVVAEDGQGVGGHRPRRHVKHRRGQLAGDLVHVRDHEEQALGRRERRGQRAGLQRSVNRTRGAALGLHLDDIGNGAPDVLAALGRPLVRELAHVR